MYTRELYHIRLGLSIRGKGRRYHTAMCNDDCRQYRQTCRLGELNIDTQSKGVGGLPACACLLVSLGRRLELIPIAPAMLTQWAHFGKLI